MPLLDHFRPPLSDLRHGESFHARWAATIAEILETDLLPAGYFAEVQVHVGARVEVDIAAFEDSASYYHSALDGAYPANATAVATPRVWTPPSPDMTLPAEFSDRVEVSIFNHESGPTLVSAIELVSPRNKDRPASRSVFAAKCATCLQQGVGMMVVDVVTSRRASLHNALMDLMGMDPASHLDADKLLAISYRPVQREDIGQIEIWHQPLTIGDALPEMPLPLDKGQCIPLDLEECYALACERTRLP